MIALVWLTPVVKVSSPSVYIAEVVANELSLPP